MLAFKGSSVFIFQKVLIMKKNLMNSYLLRFQKKDGCLPGMSEVLILRKRVGKMNTWKEVVILDIQGKYKKNLQSIPTDQRL